MQPPNLDFHLARVRELTQNCQGGGTATARHFERLVSYLLHLTILDPGSGIQLSRNPGTPDVFVLGCRGGDPTRPLVLTNRRYLRFVMSLYIDREDRDYLKTDQATYQYQYDGDGKQWIFRYDYLRRSGGRHPPSHVQVNAELFERGVLPLGQLPRVHFPVGRMPFEGVMRLLIDELAVPSKFPDWRPVLAESERLFREIAYHPPTSPDVATKQKRE